jgi:hypothetical protein
MDDMDSGHMNRERRDTVEEERLSDTLPIGPPFHYQPSPKMNFLLVSFVNHPFWIVTRVTGTFQTMLISKEGRLS